MIGLTRTSGERCLLDPADIQRVEAHPTTVVYLTDGARYCVEESIDQVAPDEPPRTRDDHSAFVPGHGASTPAGVPQSASRSRSVSPHAVFGSQPTAVPIAARLPH